MNIRICKFILPLLISVQVNAQMNLRTLSVDNGLSWYQVSDIEQDSYGFVWIATYNGLNRYDGVTCKVYRNNPEDPHSLSSNRVKSLLYDPKHNRMLIGTDGGGINIYDYSSDSFNTINIRSKDNEWLPENDIIDIKPEKGSRLWVATRQTIYLVEIDGTGVSIRQSITYSPRKVLNSLISMEDVLIAAAKTRVVRYVYNNGNYERDMDVVLPESSTLNSVQTGTDGDLWFCTDKGVFYVRNPKNGSFEFEKVQLKGNTLTDNENISTLNEIGDSLYFVVKEEGLFCRKKDGSIESVNTLKDDFWISNPIKKSFFDKSGILWMASHNKGVGFMSLNQPKFGRIVQDDAGSVMLVTSLMANEDDGTLWIGTQKEGIYIYNKKGLVSKFFEGGGITDIKKFSDGRIRVVCNGRIYKSGQEKFNEIFPIPSNVLKSVGTVFNISEISPDIIAFGCRKGIVISDGDSCQYIKMETSYYRNVVLSAHKNIVWVCSGRGGLSMISIPADSPARIEHQYTRTSLTDAHNIASNNVFTVFEASDRKIYVGTDRGLDIIDPETYTISGMKHNIESLSSNSVLAIQEDSNGVLWFNTLDGIIGYDPKTGDETVYDISDGLISNFATETSLMIDNVLYAGMLGGVSYFRTDRLIENKMPPRIAISGFRVNGREMLFKKPVMDIDEIVLDHDQNNITFNLSIFSYGNPDKNRYLYRLSGYDDSWYDVGATHPYASYSKLKKGNYCFEFKGIDWNGVESAQPKRINVTVRAVWWNTTLAKCVYILLFAIALYFIFITEKQKMRQRAQNEAAEAKLKFYDNLTHEFRTPLTLIAAPLSELMAETELPERLYRKLGLMSKNCDRLTDIVNNFLHLRKVNGNGLQLHVKYQDINLVVSNIIQRFEPLAKQKHIDLSFSSCERKYGWIDDDKINIILTNLLSNAIKFTESGGKVSVVLREDTNSYSIDVNDNGRGIAEENVGHIFERFYQVNQNPVSGTGIGLELSKSLAELHKGSLSVKSILGQGSTFTLNIPFRKNCYTEDELSDFSGNGNERNDFPDCPEKVVFDDKRKSVTILVVEDDVDMSEYIRSILSTEYRVIVAENGKTGFESALEYVPDLIVSDVMMPVMDGIEMCRLITEDSRTSHIPVVLLTAKNNEYEGLRSGAIDYIMKPFMPQNLLLKIRNMIHWRNEHSMSRDEHTSVLKRIREYSEEKERTFLQQAFEIVERNIENSKFSVEDLTVELGISKTQLHKKITALTGVSASAFIRNIRLDKGREMIETGKYSICEVLYSVGFNSPSYFSKKFYERFGILPSDLIRK